MTFSQLSACPLAKLPGYELGSKRGYIHAQLRLIFGGAVFNKTPIEIIRTNGLENETIDSLLKKYGLISPI